MNNPQFTSGPWLVSENQPTVVGNKEKAVCKCELDWNLDANERKANAALIAAAPEMYWMLEKCRTALHDCGMSCLSEDVFLLLKKARCEE